MTGLNIRKESKPDLNGNYNEGQFVRLTKLLGVSIDAIVAIDRSGIIVFWNAAAERMFGYLEDEALGSNIEIIIPENFSKAHHAGLSRVVNGGEKRVIGHTVELAAKRKDGVIIPIELSLSNWDLDGEMFFGGIIRDITIRKEHERKIHESESQLRSLTGTANDAIITADQTGRIVTWNPAAARIFGYEEEEVKNKPLEIIIPSKFRTAHRKGLSRVAGGGERHVIGNTVELEGLHKSGRVFPIELSLSSWTSENGVYFCGIIRDISTRKEQELAMLKSREKLARKTEKLKKANAQIREKSAQLQSLSQKLAKYLSHQVYHSIFEGEREVKIESYRKKLTVFFSDIQGFTELSDRVEAEVLTHLLNNYLNEMSGIAYKYGGTIDKFIGDAVMIFFGDPESKGEKEDALACVHMAIEMKQRLKSLQRNWSFMGIEHPLEVRMGINTGYCTVGNFGSEDRMDYTIVGSEVNLANRLESIASPNEILISESTYQLIKETIACTESREVVVKGFSKPIKAHQVIGPWTEEMHQKDLSRSIHGFTINLDPAALNREQKNLVRETLEQAMQILGE